MSEDPVEFFGGSANLYQYVDANPIRDRDPFGTFGLGGAAGAALFNVSIQLGTNLVASGFDLRRSVGCINVADVFVSAAFGFMGPSCLPNVLGGKPTVLGGRTENVLVYLTASLPLSFGFKLAAPSIRLGGRKYCDDLSFGAAVSKIVGP